MHVALNAFPYSTRTMILLCKLALMSSRPIPFLSLKISTILIQIALILSCLSNTVSSTTEFVFNTNFNSTSLILNGNATIQSSILSLTNDSTTFSLGRALYSHKVRTKLANSSSPLPFSTSFVFSLSPVEDLQPGHGFAFVFLPFSDLTGASSAQNLGLFNLTNNGDPNNNILGIEFDVFKNQEFDDPNDNHVGVDINSLTSIRSEAAGHWTSSEDGEKFKELKLNNGANYQVWIDFLGSTINVTMAQAGVRKPHKPLISQEVDLSRVLLDDMFVGFSGATGQLVESHRILAWSFSNSNSSIGDALVTENLPSFVVSEASVVESKGFKVGISVGGFLVICCGVLVYVIFMKTKQRKGDEETEDIEVWESEFWPHRIDYQEIRKATEGFSEKNVIGTGGIGKVYKGALAGEEVAVKRISHQGGHGMREFLAEVSSLGRLKHRNLVGLRGWCKKEKGNLILVYDYMKNGSLDKRLFDCNETMMLSWEERKKVLKDVACGLLYLHEGWEAKILHRDIKASNVLLDKDMNARLGDFGLARMHHPGELNGTTTQVVGTAGYMAPEVVQTGRASAEIDVFGFGILVLEVVCGRRPIEAGKPGLVDWIWTLMERGGVIHGVDGRLKSKGGYNPDEVERFLRLGLLCAYPEPRGRPTMRQVMQLLEGATYLGTDKSEGQEGEGIEVNLLHNMVTASMWSTRHMERRGRGHPAFEDIKESLCSSSSLFASDIIRIGR
ncbi:probable L-type lectin-domain containing receptor kinase VII.2 [Argentina anserina]|uniref:probable L-type lectin-domain containing receptor kinase VII.2 n=1 Tax=Argentina anserina TaxID=57926 RepID=UPI0021768639|nr:probable L-type lectin-domain containing receptor kinase VII.2 [Potentilla anserina]